MIFGIPILVEIRVKDPVAPVKAAAYGRTGSRPSAGREFSTAGKWK